jgi:hypothetical protein
MEQQLLVGNQNPYAIEAPINTFINEKCLTTKLKSIDIKSRLLSVKQFYCVKW